MGVSTWLLCLSGPCKALKGLILRASYIFGGIWRNIGGLNPQYLVTGATRIPPGFPRPWAPKALRSHILVIIRNERVVISWRSPRAFKPLPWPPPRPLDCLRSRQVGPCLKEALPGPQQHVEVVQVPGERRLATKATHWQAAASVAENNSPKMPTWKIELQLREMQPMPSWEIEAELYRARVFWLSMWENHAFVCHLPAV